MKYKTLFKTLMAMAVALIASSTLTAQVTNNYDAQIASILHRLDSLEQLLAEAGLGEDDMSRTVQIDNGALPGTFSVSEKTKVRFAMGNLQYQASSGTWRFAKKQHTVVGKSNSKVSATNAGWTDLFVWGTSGYHDDADKENLHYQPYSTSYEQHEANRHNSFGYGPSTNMKSKDLTGKSAQYDWGVHNAISNGGEKAGMWRTLTKDEWDYVLNKRATEMRYSIATVAGRSGVILFPDSFSMPAGIAKPVAANLGSTYKDYTVDEEQWNQMESAGAVFLPAAGYRVGASVYGFGQDGQYWSSSHESQDYAYRLNFGDGYAGISSCGRFDGFAVRLVRDEK